MLHFCLSLFLSLWIVAVATLSVQNATGVTIQFLSWQSVEMPVGIVLAFAYAVGLLLVALARPFWLLTTSPSPPNFAHSNSKPVTPGETDEEDWV